MEISGLQIIDGQNIPAIQGTEVQSHEFSQILAGIRGIQLDGLTDLEEANISLDLADIAETIANQSDEKEEDILFNPMNILFSEALRQNENIASNLDIGSQDIQVLISNGKVDSVEASLVENMTQEDGPKDQPISDIALDISKVKSQEASTESKYLENSPSFEIGLKEETIAMDKKTNINSNKYQSKESISEKISLDHRTILEEDLTLKEELSSSDDSMLKDKVLLDSSKENEVNFSTLLERPTREIVDGSGFDTELNIGRDIDFDENIQKVNDALIESFELRSANEGKLMKVKLYPEELGHIDVSLRMEEGKLVAKIMVESEQVRELFNSHINQLSDKLVKQDINVERVDVDLNFNTNSHSGSGNQQNPRKNSFNKYKEIFSLENSSTNISNEDYILGSNGLNILA